MKKNRATVKHVGIIIVFITSLLTLFFLLIKSVKDYIPIPIYLTSIVSLVKINAIAYYLFFPALFTLVFVDEQRFAKVVFAISLLVFVPFFCMFNYLAWGISSETIHNSVTADNHNYYFTVADYFAEPWTKYQVYRCASNDLDCQVIYDGIGGVAVQPTSLAVDAYTRDVYIFQGGFAHPNLVFSYGKYPHGYISEDLITIGNNYFDLYSYEDQGNRIFLLTKCPVDDYPNTLCDILPFRYSTTVSGDGKLIVDNNTNEINVMIGENLIYQHGNSPQCYQEGCIILEK